MSLIGFDYNAIMCSFTLILGSTAIRIPGEHGCFSHVIQTQVQKHHPLETYPRASLNESKSSVLVSGTFLSSIS